mmetsp:Transcript_12150/g.15630  ORF Transcript_12150/g.15630 Transcript_12150/m.15630 type:complete len:223 (+) Transcript_12150:1-669(+)
MHKVICLLLYLCMFNSCEGIPKISQGGNIAMLDWHCGTKQFSQTVLCQNHLFKRSGKTTEKPQSLGQSVDQAEFNQAKESWCSNEEYKHNTFCRFNQKTRRGHKVHIPSTDSTYKEIRSIIIWWCQEEIHSGGQFCVDLVKQMKLADDIILEATHNQNMHLMNTPQPNSLQRKLIKTFTHSMRYPDSEVHTLLEKWCYSHNRDGTETCKKWIAYRHDHNLEL